MPAHRGVRLARSIPLLLAAVISAASVCAALAAAQQPPTPPRPNRATVLHLRANFFGAPDCRGATVFDPVLAIAPDRECVYRVKRSARLTHVVLSPALRYPNFPSFDWWHDDPAKFRSLVLDVLDHGFVPVIVLAQGEHFTERAAVVDGAVAGGRVPRTDPELVAHLDRDFSRLLPAMKDLAPFCVWVPGWEVSGPGEGDWWSAATLSHAILKMRELLGPEAIIGLHLASNGVAWASDPKEPDDPSGGNPMRAMASEPAGREISLLLFQMQSDRHMADPDVKPGTGAYGRVVETLARFVKGYVGPNGEKGPYWFGGRVGPPGEDGVTRDEAIRFCAFETGAFNIVQGHFGPDKLTLIARRLRDLGVTCFGNGTPD